MRFNLRLIAILLFGLFFIAAVSGGLLWANLNFVQKVSGGGDFYVLWRGARDFLLRGSLPYQDQTKQIGNLVYGSAAHGQAVLPRLDVPFYLLFLYTPFALIADPLLARAIWMVFLEFALFGLVLLVFQLLRWKPGRLYLIILFLFGIFWAPAISALYSGSLIIFQAVLLLGAIRAIELQADELAGALIALAFFNVEAVGLLIALILWWVTTLGRMRVWGGFLMATIIQIGFSVLFNISWPLPFLAAIVSNWSTNPNPSTFSLLEAWLPGVGSRLAQALLLVIALMLIMEWRAVRGKELRWMLWTASLTLAVTPLLGMPFSPLWLVLSLPALFLVLSIMDQRWGLFGRWSAMVLFLVVFFGLWDAIRNAHGFLYVFAFPLLLVFLLYWIRWSAIRPPKLWADVISDMGK